MRRARSFDELRVYRLALEEARKLFLITRTFPREERFTLTDQLLRSSRAVGALLAEAWARRHYRGAFSEKLTQALAEAMETQAWIDHARVCEYISKEDHVVLQDTWRHIGAMLRRMVQESGRFCSPRE